MSQPDPDPDTVIRALDDHYDCARAAIHQHRTAHESYRDRERRARDAGDDEGAGREGVYADTSARQWQRALGAAEALEQLADALNVALANDRRPLIEAALMSCADASAQGHDDGDTT